MKIPTFTPSPTNEVAHLRHFVLLEDERDANAAVVEVTAVGLTVGV